MWGLSGREQARINPGFSFQQDSETGAPGCLGPHWSRTGTRGALPVAATRGRKSASRRPSPGREPETSFWEMKPGRRSTGRLLGLPGSQAPNPSAGVVVGVLFADGEASAPGGDGLHAPGAGGHSVQFTQLSLEGMWSGCLVCTPRGQGPRGWD